MIRPTTADDHPSLRALAADTGFFRPAELVALDEVLRDYELERIRADHRCLTKVGTEGRPLGFAYYAPSSMAERAWYLYWIVVAPASQGRGIGRALMAHAEADIRASGRGRLFLIETSSQPLYEPTRRFYRSLGFDLASALADFYADGDDLIVFAKRLEPRRPDLDLPAALGEE